MNQTSPHGIASFRNYLGLNRNVAILAVSTLGLGLGEELWQAYLPIYLVELGASSVMVGLFYSFRDLLDGLYQYPGGWVNDRFGRKRALMLFTMIGMSGYAVFSFATHWGVLFVGLLLVMGWKSGAFPATFAVIGDSLPKGQRSVAFSVQSILLRFPRVIGAPLGGLLITGLGVISGIRTALFITLGLAIVVLFAQHRFYEEQGEQKPHFIKTSLKDLFKGIPSALRYLLLAECFVRIGEGVSLAFIVLYVTEVLHVSASTYGALYAVQQSVAIAMYIPSGKLADVTGRKPLIALTFLFFSLFPVAVKFSTSLVLLVGAFIIGGLKEFGEPARKSYIVDLADPRQLGRTVGMYYTIRNVLIVPAGTIGGLLWQLSPDLTMYVSSAVGLCGLLLFFVGGRTYDH